MKIEDDDIISLNWDLFHEHLVKCEKCRNTCLDIWDHIRKDLELNIHKPYFNKEDFEK